MLLIFSTPVLIRHLWQLETVHFLHWCIIRAVLLATKSVVLTNKKYFWRLLKGSNNLNIFIIALFSNCMFTFSIQPSGSLFLYYTKMHCSTHTVCTKWKIKNILDQCWHLGAKTCNNTGFIVNAFVYIVQDKSLYTSSSLNVAI